ncbi:hypothetical protein WN990_34310 [Kitasatospora purpeofusca]|uniref:hypothetical protein n=1 Tax=Kitasatospora purpeofusca TaxID=67352 RepID=UPI0030F2C54E
MVTGAGAGIGRACAVAFAERGDRLALIARDRAGLEAGGGGTSSCPAVVDLLTDRRNS